MKDYIKDANMKAIFAVINTTWAVVKIRPEKKSQACRRFEPMTSELPVKLLYKTYKVEPQNESSLISFLGIAHLWFISWYVS